MKYLLHKCDVGIKCQDNKSKNKLKQGNSLFIQNIFGVLCNLYNIIIEPSIEVSHYYKTKHKVETDMSVGQLYLVKTALDTRNPMGALVRKLSEAI